jgi:hypothetical protein
MNKILTLTYYFVHPVICEGYKYFVHSVTCEGKYFVHPVICEGYKYFVHQVICEGYAPSHITEWTKYL